MKRYVTVCKDSEEETRIRSFADLEIAKEYARAFAEASRYSMEESDQSSRYPDVALYLSDRQGHYAVVLDFNRAEFFESKITT